MLKKSTSRTIKVPFTSGWVIVSRDSQQVKAHAKTFAEIVSKSKKLPTSNHVILTASKSYHGHLMITVVVK